MVWGRIYAGSCVAKFTVGRRTGVPALHLGNGVEIDVQRCRRESACRTGLSAGNLLGSCERGAVSEELALFRMKCCWLISNGERKGRASEWRGSRISSSIASECRLAAGERQIDLVITRAVAGQSRH